MGPRKRLTKREIKHDPVIEFTLRAWKYLVRHRERALTVAVVVVGLVVVIWGIRAYRASVRVEAATDLGRAVLHLQTGERAKALEILERLSAQRGGGPGRKAWYYLAQLKFEDGDFRTARLWFDRFRRRGGNDEFLRAASAKGVADCDVELGQLAQAGDEYLRVARAYRRTPWAPECLYLAGLAYWAHGDTAKAVSALTTLVREHAQFPRVGDARLLLGEIQAAQRVLGLSSASGTR